jgi:hypothetical protein
VSALFVIDRSGSMKCNLPPVTASDACERTPERADPAQPSKWEVVTGVLSTSFDQLVPRTQGLKVRAGLSFFSVDDECGARSQPSIPVTDMTTTQLDLLRQSLSITPAGGLINVEAPKALRVGIKTWVIGAPGSEPARHMLSNLARAGGTARKDCDPGNDADPTSGNCHYDMTESSRASPRGEVELVYSRFVDACVSRDLRMLRGSGDEQCRLRRQRRRDLRTTRQRSLRNRLRRKRRGRNERSERQRRHGRSRGSRRECRQQRQRRQAVRSGRGVQLARSD